MHGQLSSAQSRQDRDKRNIGGCKVALDKLHPAGIALQKDWPIPKSPGDKGMQVMKTRSTTNGPSTGSQDTTLWPFRTDNWLLDASFPCFQWPRATCIARAACLDSWVRNKVLRAYLGAIAQAHDIRYQILVSCKLALVSRP